MEGEVEERCPMCNTRLIYPDGVTDFGVCPNCGYTGPPLVVYLPPRKLEFPRYMPQPSKYTVAVRQLARELGINGEVVDEAANLARKFGIGFPPYVVAVATFYLLGLLDYNTATRIVPRRLLWSAINHLRRHVAKKVVTLAPLTVKS